jgi:hypothetical protein
LNDRLTAALEWCEQRKLIPLPRSREALRRSEYHQKRKRTDPGYRQERKARSYLQGIVSGKMSSKRKHELIGCSPAYLKKHIEKQFTPDMTWENRGIVWELDHIIPCCEFRFTRMVDVWDCFHFSNLQPLWKWLNRLKRDGVMPEITLDDI